MSLKISDWQWFEDLKQKYPELKIPKAIPGEPKMATGRTTRSIPQRNFSIRNFLWGIFWFVLVGIVFILIISFTSGTNPVSATTNFVSSSWETMRDDCVDKIDTLCDSIDEFLNSR